MADVCISAVMEEAPPPALGPQPAAALRHQLLWVQSSGLSVFCFNRSVLSFSCMMLNSTESLRALGPKEHRHEYTPALQSWGIHPLHTVIL